LNLFLGAGLFGPTSVDHAVQRCEELLEERPRPRLEAAAYRALGGLHAMRGRFGEARQLLIRDRRILDELGLVLAASAAAEMRGIVELLAGRPDEAERHLRDGLALLEPTGEKSALSTLTAILAEATYRQGRRAEALELAELSEKAAAPDDLTTQVQLRNVKAKVLADRRQAAEAERIAREGVALASSTDFLNLHGESLLALAQVLTKGGKSPEGAEAAREAAALFERKGNLIAQARARTLAQARTSAARA
jgi:ATP/maltotriose-dependent transcriptional regulator MalT